jgi:hypothetical protein
VLTISTQETDRHSRITGYNRNASSLVGDSASVIIYSDFKRQPAVTLGTLATVGMNRLVLQFLARSIGIYQMDIHDGVPYGNLWSVRH